MSQTYLKYIATPPLGMITGTSCQSVISNCGLFILTPALASINVISLKTGIVTAVLTDGNSLITCIQKSNLDIYAAGYADGSIKLWKNNSLFLSFSGHSSPVSCLAFHSQGHLLASGSRDAHIVVWDVLNECGMFRLQGHKDGISSLVFLDKHIISSSLDSLIKVWDTDAKHCVETIVNRAPVTELALLDNRLISVDSHLRVWSINKETLATKLSDLNTDANVNSIKQTHVIEKHGKDRTICLSVHPKGRFLALCSNDKSIQVFKVRNQDEIKKSLARKQKRQREKPVDPNNETEVESVDEIVPHSILFCSFKVKSFDFQAKLTNDLFTIICALSNNSIECYNSNDDVAEPFLLQSTFDIQGHRSDIRSLALSSDDDLIASGSSGI